MKKSVVLATIFLVFSMSAHADDPWIAYNDCVYVDGAQFIADNVTTFGIGRTNTHPEFGDLIKFSDGSATGVAVTYTEFITAGSVNWATDASTFDAGSDADEIFGGIIDPTGNISYGDAPGWYVDLTIEGLDPEGAYIFVGTVNRGGAADYEDRITNWTIMGAQSFLYECSEDAHKVSEDSVEFVTGNNNDGLIARWTNIAPGDDGEIVIRTTHGVGSDDGGMAGANEYKGYAGGMFMLEYQGPNAVEPDEKLTATWGGLKSTR